MSTKYYIPVKIFKTTKDDKPSSFRIPLNIIFGNDDWKFDEYLFPQDKVRVLLDKKDNNNKENNTYKIQVNYWELTPNNDKCVIQLPTGQYYIVYNRDVIIEYSTKIVPYILPFTKYVHYKE